MYILNTHSNEQTKQIILHSYVWTIAFAYQVFGKKC